MTTAWNDPTTLTRVLRETVQRVICDLGSLASYAAFVLASDRAKKIIVWIGRRCSNTDAELAEYLARQINYEEYGGPEDFVVPIVYEAGETFATADATSDSSPDIGLKAFLELFWVEEDEYKAAAKKRERVVKNEEVVFSQLIQDSSGRIKNMF